MAEVPNTEQAGLDVALNKAATYRERDPFPLIPPALLNSADIEDYANKIGMLHPFDVGHLKSASYSVSVGKKIVYWDGTGDERKFSRLPVTELAMGQEFLIPKNSVVFVQTEEVFLLPPYIAARFNLQISLVHKGLLLGTGPLVDPGFRGELVVPLHNLTENDYALCRGDEFIWVEFTKLSPNVAWDKAALVSKTQEQRLGTYRPYKEKAGTGKTPWPRIEDYLGRALRSENPNLSPHSSIRNSLPNEIDGFRKQISASVKQVDTAASRVNQLAVAAVLVPILAALGAYFGFVAPLAEARVQANTAQLQVIQLRKEIDGLQKILAVDPANSSEIDRIHHRLDTLELPTKATTTPSTRSGHP